LARWPMSRAQQRILHKPMSRGRSQPSTSPARSSSTLRSQGPWPPNTAPRRSLCTPTPQVSRRRRVPYVLESRGIGQTKRAHPIKIFRLIIIFIRITFFWKGCHELPNYGESCTFRGIASGASRSMGNTEFNCSPKCASSGADRANVHHDQARRCRTRVDRAHH
jgi:hypothetical protein